jgi:hypothetical protein
MSPAIGQSAKTDGSPGAYRTVLVPRGSSKPEWLGEV